MGGKTRAIITAGGVALGAAATSAEAGAMARLFPYAFADRGAAAAACGTLTSTRNIANAAKGTLVYMSAAGRRTLVPHSGVADLLKAIDDPTDAVQPTQTRIENDTRARFMVVADHPGQPQRGAIRCWFSYADDSFRLVSVEIAVATRATTVAR